MEEKKTVEIISKEDVERLIATLNEAEVAHPEIKSEDVHVDTDKVKEVVASLEGCTVHTVVAVLSTAMILLPTGAVAAVLDMGKSTLKARAFSMLAQMLGKCKGDCDNCPECPTACDEAPKE